MQPVHLLKMPARACRGAQCARAVALAPVRAHSVHPYTDQHGTRNQTSGANPKKPDGALEFLLDAADRLLDSLNTIDAGADLHKRADTRGSHLMDDFKTPIYCSHDRVPVPFDAWFRGRAIGS